MKKQDGLSHIAMVIIIVMLVIIGFVAYKFIMGKEGFIQEMVVEEENFSQKEVLEEINKMVTEKYLEIYNANPGGNIEASYNTDVIVSYFGEIELLSVADSENTYDEAGYKVYVIDINKLNRDVSKNQIANLESNIAYRSNEVYALRRAIVTNEDGTQSLDKKLELCFKNKSDAAEWKIVGEIIIDNPVSTEG